MSFALPSAVRPQAGASGTGLARIARALTLTAICLIFLLSPGALDRLGFDYIGTGGNPLTKIHPGTEAAALAILFWLMALGPRRFFERLLAHPGFIALGAALLFLIVYDVESVGEPVTPLIDTYTLPLCVGMGLLLDETAPQPALRTLLHGIFALNALVGIGEFLFTFRLFPMRIAGVVTPDDWRSSALFGHPLTNAILVATYVVALLAGGRGLSPRVRIGAILLQGAALTVFGGRTGLVLSLVAVAGALAMGAFRFLRGQRIQINDLIFVIIAVPALAAVGGVLAETGFFDRLVERFFVDEGSAQTRVIMLRLLGQLSPTDLLFGTDPRVITTLVHTEGIEYGIESFEIAMIVKFGMLPCFIFFASLAAFAIDVVRATRLSAILPLATFFFIASTSLSIAEKATELGMAATLILVLLRDPPLEAGA